MSKGMTCFRVTWMGEEVWHVHGWKANVFGVLAFILWLWFWFTVVIVVGSVFFDG